MKKFLYLLLATAMLATFGCTGDTNTNSLTNPRGTAWTPKGEITGYLFDKPNHAPIAGATISVAGANPVVTKADGSFLIKGVPANTYVDGNGQIQRDDDYDQYTVVVDMTKINAAIAAANLKNKTNNPLYPQYKTTSVRVKFTDLGETNSDTRANESVPTTTNGNTPVNGFRASLFEDLAVGKLSGAVALQILEPVQGKPFSAGAVSVRLSSNGSDNSGTGDFYNQVTAPKTTDADGYVFFDALEIGQDFTVFATAVANGRTYELRVNGKQLTNRVATKGEFVAVWYATTINTAKIPATTVTNSNLHIGGPFYLEDVTQKADVSSPVVASTSPLEMSDIVATEGTETQQIVTITFNEPINANTNYAQALTEQQASIAGLWNDVYVRYDGPKKGAKAGNIAHTIEWDATSGTLATGYTRLLVKFDTMPGSKYTVAIVQPRDIVNPTLDSEDFALTDMAGNDLDYDTGRLFYDGARYRHAAARVSFTTSYDDYNETPLATPVPLRVGDSSLVRWAAIDGATAYKVYVERFVDGNGSGRVFIKETPFAQFDVNCAEVQDIFDTNFVFETGEQKVTYQVYVVAYNPSRASSAFGAADQLVDDQAAPFVMSTSGTFPAVAGVVAGSGSVSGTFVLNFDKQLYNVLGAAEVLSKWTGAITAAPTAGSLTFAATAVTYNPDPDDDITTQGSRLTVAWTITNSNAAAQTINSYTLSSTAASLNAIEIGQYYAAP